MDGGTQGGSERDGRLLVVKGMREEEVRKEVTDWLRRIKVLP